MNQKIKVIGLAVGLALALTLLFMGGVLAADDANLPYTIDTFDQCRNDTGSGPCSWSNGAINNTNSKYYEDDGTVQRLYLTDVPGGTQVVEIKYQTTKGGKHAYDYLVTYNYSENYVGQTELCDGLPSDCTSWSSAMFPVPSDPNVSGAGVTQKPGVFTIFNGTITGVSGYSLDAPYTGDSETTIVVSFTATTDKVLIVWGGHIASQSDWGLGNSAIAITGAPYHQIVYGHDNQVMAGAIIPPAQLTIVKSTDKKNSSIFTYSITSNIENLSSPFYLMDDHPDLSNDPPSQITFTELKQGVYTVTEESPLPGDWMATAIECSGTYLNSGQDISPSDLDYQTTIPGTSARLVINLLGNQNVTCIFYNHSPTAVTLSSMGANVANEPDTLITIVLLMTILSTCLYLIHNRLKSSD